MPNYIVQGSDLSSVATAIRTKGGTSAQLAFPTGFVSAIEALPSGGGGEGFSLLAGGTYTLVSDATTMTIPVSYSGTEKFFYVVAKTGMTNGGTWAWFKAEAATLGADAPAFSCDRYGATDSGFGSSTNISLANNQISCPRANSANTVFAQDYNWYIFGEEAAT